MVTVLEELFDVVSDVFKIHFLLLFLLAFIDSFGFIDIFKNRSLLLVSFVPVFYAFYSFDRAEFFVVDIGVVCDADEGFVDVGLGE